ncbi:MAG TPA: hypothetical protein VG737_01865 [Cyclobacteriaceae bacterium]|nr:hypothetical protein [Cyclobacteriaceae bacterium]
MRTKALNIAFPLILIANLLFSQVVVNLLHDPHDFHQQATELQKEGKSALQKHGEHCKICSLDILFNLLPSPSHNLDATICAPAPLLYSHVDAEQAVISFFRDRAPPVAIF